MNKKIAADSLSHDCGRLSAFLLLNIAIHAELPSVMNNMVIYSNTKIKKEISMKGILFFVALVLLVSLIGFATNPSYEDYKEWYKTQNYENVEAFSKLEQSVVGLVSDFVADSIVVRDDYKVFSLYTMDSDNYNYKVIGVFNNFFVLENEDAEAVSEKK